MRRNYTEAEKQRHLKRYQESGLSQKAYCAKQNLSWTTFKNWKKRANSSDPAAVFAPVTISETAAPYLVVETAEGWRIQIPANCPVEHLQQLFNALRCNHAA